MDWLGSMMLAIIIVLYSTPARFVAEPLFMVPYEQLDTTALATIYTSLTAIYTAILHGAFRIAYRALFGKS